MSAAAAPADATAAPKKGKKKLIIIIVAVLLAAGGGGGTWFYLQKKAAAEAAAAAAAGEDGEVPAPAKKAKKADKGAPPAFLPLEPFTVNLADRDRERFLQLGITLEVEDAKTSDQLKSYMPAIRNNILMVISHKTTEELQAEDGKRRLAREIQREALRPIGVEMDDDDDDDEAPPKKAAKGDADADDPPAKPKKKKKRKKVAQDLPVTAVHFSSFIIQ